MTTAFVFSGGCSLAAVQVGMLRALSERGVLPDLLVGTSAGALNAAFVAGHGADRAAVDRLASVWTGLHGHGPLGLDVRRAARALAGRAPAFCSADRLRALVQRHLTFDDLADAPLPLTLVATDLLSGREVALSAGPARDAVLASAALPGLLPPVDWDGRPLVDGALADNTAISQAVASGADEIYVLPSGYACALPRPPRTPLGTLAHAVTLLLQQRLVADLDRYAGQVDLVVLPAPCPLRVSALDFGHAAELIDRAHADATRWLDRDGGRRADPAAAVGLHAHPTGPDLSPAGGRSRRAG
jgi:NTE family protein